MTSGGITKRTFCVWATVAAFVAAMLCAIDVLGLIFFAGAWINGFPQSADPDKEQW